MRALVITILDNPRSVAAAERCIASGAEHGVSVEMLAAITPDRDPLGIMHREGILTERFEKNPYSRPEPTAAAFLSHRAAWSLTSLLILEHDAVFVAPLPSLSTVKGLCNLGKPSFGRFRVPPDGLGPFCSKAGGYLGGAHAYYVTAWGARQLIEKATTEAEPTDVFLSVKRFPWMEECHPWPVVCDDSFTTIQRAEGCAAKHNRVEIVEA